VGPPKFSVVIPARNEERFIGVCLDSIRAASDACPGDVEVIVVLNRCSDKTEEIAKAWGARTIREDARNLARIRNAGAREAQGRILVTIDADSRMTAGTLTAIDCALAYAATIGGGVHIFPDRYSMGIRVTVWLFRLMMLAGRFSGGLFWCRRDDFEALGGFDERLVSGEDIDFALRLKALGRKTGRRFETLRGGHIVTSCRKFDEYGDWCVLTKPLLVWRLFRGNHQREADAFYYEFKR